MQLYPADLGGLCLRIRMVAYEDCPTRDLPAPYAPLPWNPSNPKWLGYPGHTLRCLEVTRGAPWPTTAQLAARGFVESQHTSSELMHLGSWKATPNLAKWTQWFSTSNKLLLIRTQSSPPSVSKWMQCESELNANRRLSKQLGSKWKHSESTWLIRTFRTDQFCFHFV